MYGRNFNIVSSELENGMPSMTGVTRTVVGTGLTGLVGGGMNGSVGVQEIIGEVNGLQQINGGKIMGEMIGKYPVETIEDKIEQLREKEIFDQLREKQIMGQWREKEMIGGVWTQPEIVGDICKLPRVFPFCHSTRQGLEEVFEHVERNPTDFGMHCLLNTHSISSPRTHPYRGYTILNGEGKIRQIEQLIGEQVEQQKPIWLVFSGMGIEDWRSGMGRELMKLDAFRRSIMRSCEIVRPFGINLMDIVQGTNGVNGVTGGDLVLPALKSLIGLTGLQIALVDCLRQVGIKHDGLVGYSVAGELACGYAEQLLSHEQALLSAYYIGKCIQEAKGLPEGLMVKVCDLTWEQMKQRCPQGVVPVCIDSIDQYLLTGPKTIVRDFLRQLQLEGVFVKEIQMQPESSNFALLHTPYMQTIVPVLRKYLECLNMTPKQRTLRWISSTVVDQPWSTYMSPVEHIINTLCNPVMFHNVVRQVPKNSIVIEVAPRSLIQTLLKKIMLQQSTMIGGGSYVQQTPVVIPLMPLWSYEQQQQQQVSDLLQHFLVQLGRLYLEGVNLDSSKLYVPSQWTQSVYPVPISHDLFNKISKWGIQPQPSTYVIKKTPFGTTTVFGTGVEGISSGLTGLTIGSLPSGVQTYKYCIDIESLLEKDSYLMGHQINGRVLYPTTGYLYLVWKSLAQLCKPTGISQQNEILSSVFGGCQDECLPGVCFENVQIHRATVLRDIFEQQQQQQFGLPQGVKQIVFQVNIEPVSGQFELVEGRNVIVSGRAYVPTTGRQYPTIEGLTTFVEGGRRVGGGRFLGGYDGETVVSRLAGLEGQWGLDKYEIYQQFKKLGYEFNGEFQGIVGSNLNGTQGEVAWTGRWIPFLDTLLQLNVLNQIQQGQRGQSGLLLPTRIRQIVIEPRQHLNVRLGSVPVTYDPYTNKTVCGGVEINGLHLTPVVLPQGQFYPTISQGVRYGGEQVSFVQYEKPTTFGTVGGIVPVEGVVPVGGELPVFGGLFGGLNGVSGQFPVVSGLFNPQQTYVLVGGLDHELGLYLAHWMVQCGVKYLVLTTQVPTVETPGFIAEVNQLKPVQVGVFKYLQSQFGCDIRGYSSSLCDESECLLFVKQACRMTSHLQGLIGGVFHLEGLFNPLCFNSVYHLEKLTRSSAVMPETGLFVVFTKPTVCGSVIPSLESICDTRRGQFGKHCLLVDWTELCCQQPTESVYGKIIYNLHKLLVKSVLPFGITVQTVGGYLPTGMTTVGPVSPVPFVPVEPVSVPVGQRQVVLMPKRIIEKLNEIEYTGTQVPVFVVHPIEGHVSMLKHWAKHMKFPVFGLQFTQDALKCETVEQLAEFYWQQIEKLYPTIQRVHLMGHSFGVPVAFEMALRRCARAVTLSLLDSGLTQNFFNGCVGGARVEPVSEIEALYRFYQQYAQSTLRQRYGGEQFLQVLGQLPTIDERIRYVVNQLIEKSPFQFDLFDLEQAIRSYVCKTIMCSKYVPRDQLRLNQVLYVRPTPTSVVDCLFQQHPEEVIEQVVNGLKKVVCGKLQVQVVDADQRTFLEGETGCRIASLLNDCLVKFF